MYGVTVPRTVTIRGFRNKTRFRAEIMLQKMTPVQIVYSVRGISNSSNICTITSGDKVAIRHVLQIIEFANLSN